MATQKIRTARRLKKFVASTFHALRRSTWAQDNKISLRPVLLGLWKRIVAQA